MQSDRMTTTLPELEQHARDEYKRAAAAGLILGTQPPHPVSLRSLQPSSNDVA